jgi:hypothetical protein
MPSFRSLPVRPSPAPAPTDETVRALIADAVRPAHFFVAAPLSLAWEGPVRETIPWETFRGRLLDPAFTRQRRSFEAWNVHVVEEGHRSAEPLLSVKWDAAAAEVHVVRALFCYAWEGYDSGGNVYLSRETRKWMRELVGTLSLTRLAGADALRDELMCRLFQAVVGTSRLPLTSLEAPLPAFSLGQLAYYYRPAAPPAAGPVQAPDELAAVRHEAALAPVEQAKLLETLLHATPPEGLGRMADAFFREGDSPTALLRLLFNEVSLSPYTDLADKVIALLGVLVERGTIAPAGQADFLGGLLRQLVRHLSAYDLVTFHQRGANYPDALLLDALLRAYLGLIERHPALFASDREQAPRRRRALRQAWLVRSGYEGLPVPDAPTSQGEALRVLPAPHARVPEEQILQPARRQRRLFADDPLAARGRGEVAKVLRQGMSDLDQPDELRELGMALFLDRPFGVGKAPTEPDATLLLSYEAFSPSLAGRRLDDRAEKLGFLSAEDRTRHRERLRGLSVRGIPVALLPGAARPGVVSLADARQAARDFVVLRTTARSVRAFLDLYDFAELRRRFRLDFLAPDRFLLLLGGAGPCVMVHDAELRPRLELTFDTGRGYESRAGIEYPAGGLRVGRVWEDGATPGELREYDFGENGPIVDVRGGAVGPAE